MVKTHNIVVSRDLERLFREGLMDSTLVDFVEHLRATYPIGPEFCTPEPDEKGLPASIIEVPEEVIREVQAECLRWYQGEMSHKISVFAAFDQIAYPVFLDAMLFMGVVAEHTEPPREGRPKNEELRESIASGLDRGLSSKKIAAEWLYLHHSVEYPGEDAAEALRKMTYRVKTMRRGLLQPT